MENLKYIPLSELLTEITDVFRAPGLNEEYLIFNRDTGQQISENLKDRRDLGIVKVAKAIRDMISGGSSNIK